MKTSSERFVDLFRERIKFSGDKYAVLRVRCYKYVRESLKSEEARKLVTIVAKMVILYSRWLFYMYIWNVLSGTVCSRS